MTTSVTLKIETTAPAASTDAGQVEPVTSSRMVDRPASWPSNASTGCAATATTATSDVDRRHDHSAQMIASGRLRRGFLTSSPAVDTASSPM